MNGEDFLRIVKDAFVPFLAELGFTMAPPSISGRLYRVNFTGPRHTVAVSFEPGEKAFLVLVFSQEQGELSDIDDRSKTLRLSDLNSQYMKTVSAEQRVANEVFFKSVAAKDDEEKALLKCAKELRLVLPRYLAEQRGW